MVSAPAKVLVVEDEPDLREMLVYHLRREGFAVSTTGDGHEAHRMVRTDTPHVVLLDLMIDGMNGLDLCRLWKAREQPLEVRIIVVSARTDESDVLQGLALGADVNHRHIKARAVGVGQVVTPPWNVHAQVLPEVDQLQCGANGVAATPGASALSRRRSPALHR